MRRLLRLGAPLLLATLVAGGVLTPALHRIAHAGESARLRLAHRAAGHHHHGALDAHGVEWTTACPDPPAPELDCAVCAGLSAHAAVAPVALVPPRALDHVRPSDGERGKAEAVASASIRGPPAA